MPFRKMKLSATRIGEDDLVKSFEPNVHPRLTLTLTADVKMLVYVLNIRRYVVVGYHSEGCGRSLW